MNEIATSSIFEHIGKYRPVMNTQIIVDCHALTRVNAFSQLHIYIYILNIHIYIYTYICIYIDVYNCIYDVVMNPVMGYNEIKWEYNVGMFKLRKQTLKLGRLEHTTRLILGRAKPFLPDS